jgi:hypothetical protein
LAYLLGIAVPVLMPATFVWVAAEIALWCLVIVATVFISDSRTAASQRD